MTGSPPHTRGKVTGLEKEVDEVRITPAYAGKSYSALCYTDSRKDHPRIRGEKYRHRP